MEQQLAEFKRAGDFVLQYGLDIVVALLILIVGLLLAKTLNRLIRKGLGRLISNDQWNSTVSNAVYVLLLLVIVGIAMQQVGIPSLIVRRVLFAVTLIAVGLIVLFRPYIPTLPYKAGNTIKTGDLLGKVEATSLINTKLKTFDGTTIYVPNSKILNDYFINYHVTPSRRFKVDVGIRYDEDLLEAKRILEILMISDPRVLSSPRPVVWVTKLDESCVKLGARAWVNNSNYWKTRCELIEKVKYRFDHEGIQFAFPRRDVHLYEEGGANAQSNEEPRPD